MGRVAELETEIKEIEGRLSKLKQELRDLPYATLTLSKEQLDTLKHGASVNGLNYAAMKWLMDNVKVEILPQCA